jgi:hypothetical protein
MSLVVHHHEAWVNVMAGRFDDAARVASQALELDGNFSFGWWWLGIAQTELRSVRCELRVATHHLWPSRFPPERATRRFAVWRFVAPAGELIRVSTAVFDAGLDLELSRTLPTH